VYFLFGLIYMNFYLSGNCFCQTKAARMALGPLVWWIFIPVIHIDVRDIVKLNGIVLRTLHIVLNFIIIGYVKPQHFIIKQKNIVLTLVKIF